MFKYLSSEKINNIKKRKDISFFKKAFTLTEVVIATFISAMILSFIFIFIVNIVDSISNVKTEVNIMSSFYDFNNKINNLRNVYITWWILIETSTWSDVFLMKDFTWENGILIGPVKLSNNKLETDNLVYEAKWIWFRKLSSSEIIEIETNINLVYDYLFQKDQIFFDLKLQDLVLISYNSWEIYNLGLVVDLNFQNSLIWQMRQNLPKDSLRRFNIDF